MKRSGILLVMAILLGGCATATVSNLVANNNMNMVHLSRGMSKAKVLCIMRSGVSVYNCEQAGSKTPYKVTISNPFHTEMMETSGKTLEVMYYVTNLKNANCIIEDDELTPLVFEDNKLIGWGKRFLLSVLPDAKAPVVSQAQPAALPAAPVVKTEEVTLAQEPGPETKAAQK